MIVFVEYSWHKYVLHHVIPGPIGRMLRHFCMNHAIGHHRDGLNDLHAHINTPVVWGIVPVLPVVAVLLATGEFVEALSVVIVIASYCRIWSDVHACIHGVGGDWAAYFPGYTRIKRHHLSHHEHTGNNLSALFAPVMDRVVGTEAKS